MTAVDRNFSEFVLVDLSDGTSVEVPVRVEYRFTPAPMIDRFRVIIADGRDITTLLDKNELDRLIALSWQNEGAARPILDLACYMPNPSFEDGEWTESKPPKLVATSGELAEAAPSIRKTS